MTRDENAPRLSLSKSLFIRGIQCYKSLYLDRYLPELRGEVSGSTELVMQGGTDTGALARDLFPDGVEIPYEGLSHQEQLDQTKLEMERGTPVLYEAAFSYDDIFIKADILRRVNGWELYEVKASTSIKDHYIYDVAVQYYVLKGLGISVSRASLVFLNNEYVRNGDIEVDKLFTVEDVTDRVMELQDSVAEEILKMREMLSRDTPPIDIGEHCDDPYECDFKGYCWQHIPEDSVFDLKQRGARPFDFYRQGIILMKDIPLKQVSGKQLMQVEAFLGQKEIIDHVALKEFLDSLWYPLYFLDFETFMWPIPLYDGMKPYQQLPFQYSLHYMEHERGTVLHHEYLAQPNVDPRPELARKLLSEIPVAACVLAFNAGFEAARLRELADFLPQYEEKIGLILENIRDLAAPFRSRHVYHWRMRGSYSQKSVLPALVPELTYEGMEVGHGGEAMEAYEVMCQIQDTKELERIRNALLEYCKLDTLGMARILDRLKEISSRR